MSCGRTCCVVAQPNDGDRLLPETLFADEAEGYLSLSKRNFALACILICELLIWISYNAVMLWIPQKLSLSPTPAYTFGEIDNIMKIVLFMAPIFAGVAMDAWIKKTYVLMLGVVMSSVGIASITFLIMYEKENAGSYLQVYFPMMMGIAVMEAFISVALPTLGGDQIPDRNDVRLFYAAFYWFQKAGKVISCGIYFHVLYIYNHENPLCVGWPILIISSAVISVVPAMMVSHCKWIRQIRGDSSVVTNPFKIVKQSVERKSERADGEHFLSPSKLSNGGTFPDPLVDDITKVFKFMVVVLCLLPVAFAVKLTGIQANCYYSSKDSDKTGTNGSSHHFIANNSQFHSYADPNTMLSPVIDFSTTLATIPLIHILCVWLAKRDYPPTVLHRFIAGHIVIITGNLVSIMYIDSNICSIERVVILSILAGLCRAFIYTTGYELTLLSAPRSMQGTAMGMFHFMDGTSGLIYMIVFNVNTGIVTTQELNEEFAIGGCVAPTCGLAMLIFLEMKFKLGLRIH